MVAAQQGADDPGFPGPRRAEVVSQFELAAAIVPRPHQFLHDLHEHTRRVIAQRAARSAEHFFPGAAQGADTLMGPADLQGIQEIEHGDGKPQTRRRRQLLDAVGMQMRIQKVFEGFTGFRFAEDIAEHNQQPLVIPVEEQSRDRLLHGKIPRRRINDNRMNILPFYLNLA